MQFREEMCSYIEVTRDNRIEFFSNSINAKILTERLSNKPQKYITKINRHWGKVNAFINRFITKDQSINDLLMHMLIRELTEGHVDINFQIKDIDEDEAKEIKQRYFAEIRKMIKRKMKITN